MQPYVKLTTYRNMQKIYINLSSPRGEIYYIMKVNGKNNQSKFYIHTQDIGLSFNTVRQIHFEHFYNFCVCRSFFLLITPSTCCSLISLPADDKFS